MSGRERICLLIAVALSVAHTFVYAQESVLSLQRMGAGVPAGWRVEASASDWSAEPSPGPLGVGAARIQFHDSGYVEIKSPGQFMKPDVLYALALYMRSEPAVAKVEVSLRDNDREEVSFLKETVTVTETWQRMTCHCVLPKSLKGRYWLDFRMEGEDCQLWVDGLWLGEVAQPPDKEWQPKMYPAAVVLEPQARWGVVVGEQTMRVNAKVVGVTQPGCQLRLHAVHTNGQDAELPLVDLSSGGIWQGSFDIKGDVSRPFGMLRVEGEVVDADGTILSPKSETLLAHVLPPIPGPLPESPFGVHVSLREPDLTVVSKLGYKWCRLHDADASTKWGVAEPAPGKWLWFDDKIALAQKHGLSVLGMLDGAPAWESGDMDKGYWSIYHAPKDIEKWRNYVRTVVRHYQGVINEWEVWNEPWDLYRFFQAGSPPLYSKLLKTAYEEAKLTNPACTVAGLDTYPPFWEASVLSFGAYPYYDTATWHRYDPNLQGRPRDAIACVTDRINAEQAKYGSPRPLFCSEGGIDVTLFHGSFFSFADPVIAGDWSRGADAYARMYLGIIASGNKRFISYSMHTHPRHGTSTHMMVEPNFLMRPMHAALSALAYFTDGATYTQRLAPAHDVTALIFQHKKDHLFPHEPGMVAVLFANGEDPEDLPRPIPASIRCFDRFGNPIFRVTQATRGPVYLMADKAHAITLTDALKPLEECLPEESSIDGLIAETGSALAKNSPPLWTLFSSQTAVLILPKKEGIAVIPRQELKPESRGLTSVSWPANFQISHKVIQPAGCFTMGAFDLSGDREAWRAVFSAVQDGPGDSWRYTCLALIPQGDESDPVEMLGVDSVLRVWEQCFVEAETDKLYATFRPAPCAVAAATRNGEYFTFDRFEYLVAMLNTAVLWGPAARSSITMEEYAVRPGIAAVRGTWKLSSLAFGIGNYPFIASLVQEGEGWKLAALCIGPEPD
ncbi:MAG TPA: hypothetical protein PLI09_26405 [Candidatus Hydrogenedentes bacterium]|nr:hypothetical protein [Candidatus Hydrogenedentota bacterium]